MKLRKWLFINELSITYFAATMKIDRSYVHMWMRGKKVPSGEIMGRVRKFTMGKVSELRDLKDEKKRRSLHAVRQKRFHRI